MKKWKVEQGKERGVGALKGETPGVERSLRAVNLLRGPRRPLPLPHALLSAFRAGGRDPAAPGADEVWNPEEESGRRRPLSSRLGGCWPHFPDPTDLCPSEKGRRDPGMKQPLCAPFSSPRLPGKPEVGAGTWGWAIWPCLLHAPF